MIWKLSWSLVYWKSGGEAAQEPSWKCDASAVHKLLVQMKKRPGWSVSYMVQIANQILQIRICKSENASCKLQIQIWLQIKYCKCKSDLGCKSKNANCKLQIANCKFKNANCKLKNEICGIFRENFFENLRKSTLSRVLTLR